MMNRRTVLFILLLVLFFVAEITAQGPVANFPINDCGKPGGKQCIGTPEPTCLSSGICTFLAKYTYDPMTNPDKVNFELHGIPPVAGNSNFWICLGINHVTGSMAGSLVNECLFNEGQVDVFTSFNSEGYVNRRTTPAKLGISGGSGALSNGILNCTFTLDRVRELSGVEFNLSQPLFAILGHGAANAWTVRYHVTTPVSLKDPVAFASVAPVPEGYSNLQSLRTVTPLIQADVEPPTTTSTSRRTATAAQDIVTTPISPSGALRMNNPQNTAVIPESITQCGLTKGCLTNPGNCLNNQANCQSILSYQQDPQSPNSYRMELWRKMGQEDNQYVALGLSNTSPGMAKSGVVGCVQFGGKVEVMKSFNPGYYNMPVENPYEGISNSQTASNGTHMYCLFSLDKALAFKYSEGTTEVNLNDPVFLMLAHGPARQQGGLGKHSTTPLASSSKVQMSSLAGADVKNNILLKAHGGLMAGAWMFLASVGIFTARYYKNMWLSFQPFGLKMWFHVHRPIMILTVAASIAGFVVIFVHAKQWTATPITENPHPAIGMVAFILALIQPIMALFRPHPGTPNRPYFNWAHFFVGFSAHILAIAAVLLGLRMHQLNLDEGLREAAFWIVVAYASFHGLWLVILQMIDLIAPRLGRKRQSTMQMKTMNGNGSAHQDATTNVIMDPASRVKTILWFIHLLVIAGLTTAVLVIIGVSGD